MLTSIEASSRPLGLTDLLVLHPDVPRRTAQRWLSRLLADGAIQAIGEGRARQYLALDAVPPPQGDEGGFPDAIPITEESRDILAYLDQPLEARKPTGYMREFLTAYQPNETWYLPESAAGRGCAA